MKPDNFYLFWVGHTFLSDSEMEWTPLIFELPNAPAVNDIIDNENVSISNDDNVTNIYTVDNKIYNQWKKNDKKQISNFGDLVNPNNNTNCITDKSCY